MVIISINIAEKCHTDMLHISVQCFLVNGRLTLYTEDPSPSSLSVFSEVILESVRRAFHSLTLFQEHSALISLAISNDSNTKIILLTSATTRGQWPMIVGVVVGIILLAIILLASVRKRKAYIFRFKKVGTERDYTSSLPINEKTTFPMVFSIGDVLTVFRREIGVTYQRNDKSIASIQPYPFPQSPQAQCKSNLIHGIEKIEEAARDESFLANLCNEDANATKSHCQESYDNEKNHGIYDGEKNKIRRSEEEDSSMFQEFVDNRHFMLSPPYWSLEDPSIGEEDMMPSLDYLTSLSTALPYAETILPDEDYVGYIMVGKQKSLKENEDTSLKEAQEMTHLSVT